MIIIKDKHLRLRDNDLIKNSTSHVALKIQIFQSYDKRFVEQQVNDFLDDHIFIACEHHEYKQDTTPYWQLSDKTPLILHEVILLYYDWPF